MILQDTERANQLGTLRTVKEGKAWHLWNDPQIAEKLARLLKELRVAVKEFYAMCKEEQIEFDDFSGG